MLVTAQTLHGRIIDKFYRPAECPLEVKANPSPSQIAWFRNRSVSQYRSWEADRDNVVFPISCNFLHSRNHLLGSQGRTRCKLPRLALPADEHLDMRSADIDDQHVHKILSRQPLHGDDHPTGEPRSLTELGIRR